MYILLHVHLSVVPYPAHSSPSTDSVTAGGSRACWQQRTAPKEAAQEKNCMMCGVGEVGGMDVWCWERWWLMCGTRGDGKLEDEGYI